MAIANENMKREKYDNELPKSLQANFTYNKQKIRG